MVSQKECARGCDNRRGWRLVGCRVTSLARQHVFDAICMNFEDFNVSEKLRNRALKWRVRKRLGVSAKRYSHSEMKFISGYYAISEKDRNGFKSISKKDQNGFRKWRVRKRLGRIKKPDKIYCRTIRRKKRSRNSFVKSGRVGQSVERLQ